MKRILLIAILHFTFLVYTHAQNLKASYINAFKEQHQMLTGQKPVNFKRAVYLTENAFYGDKLNYQAFCLDISNLAIEIRSLIHQKGIEKYRTAGNWGTFTFMTDSMPANSFKPYTYDFDDFTGTKDWSKQFVSKLLKTHSGNCHSLPFLYKILCEELGTSAYLALAPNHVYIKHLDENNQWTNVELTNPGFPRDQWIIKEMAITVEAIKKNIYMKPLSQKESVAMAMFDLACGYKSYFGYDDFVLQAATTALKYFPQCVPLIQLKANCLLARINLEKKKRNPDTAKVLLAIALHKKALASVNHLGYKDMPIELYKEWVQSVEQEKQKRNSAKSLKNK